MVYCGGAGSAAQPTHVVSGEHLLSDASPWSACSTLPCRWVHGSRLAVGCVCLLRCRVDAGRWVGIDRCGWCGWCVVSAVCLSAPWWCAHLLVVGAPRHSFRSRCAGCAVGVPGTLQMGRVLVWGWCWVQVCRRCAVVLVVVVLSMGVPWPIRHIRSSSSLSRIHRCRSHL